MKLQSLDLVLWYATILIPIMLCYSGIKKLMLILQNSWPFLFYVGWWVLKFCSKTLYSVYQSLETCPSSTLRIHSSFHFFLRPFLHIGQHEVTDIVCTPRGREVGGGGGWFIMMGDNCANHLFIAAGQALFCAHEGGWVVVPMTGAHHDGQGGNDVKMTSAEPTPSQHNTPSLVHGMLPLGCPKHHG